MAAHAARTGFEDWMVLPEVTCAGLAHAPTAALRWEGHGTMASCVLAYVRVAGRAMRHRWLHLASMVVLAAKRRTVALCPGIRSPATIGLATTSTGTYATLSGLRCHLAGR